MSDEPQYYGGAFKYVGVVNILFFLLHEVILRVHSVSRRKIIEDKALKYSELHRQHLRAKTSWMTSAHR